VDEARLIYLAVHQWYGWSAGRLLILDIGGGSMEIVLGRDAEPELAMSLPLGADG
jgi:exopolyphosphatase/guanosine-5'-triphosphate,3'-diphosphate pyrophosphatase